MKQELSKIIYCGNDEDYFLKLKESCTSILGEGVEYLQFNLLEIPLVDILKKKSSYLFILDVTSKDFPSSELIAISKLKLLSWFKPIVVMGLFASEEHVDNCRNLAVSGINFFQIKGSEDSLLITEAIYAAFQAPRYSVPFATADGLESKLKVYLPANICAISDEYLEIECDLSLSEDTADELSLELSLFEEDNTLAFEIEYSWEKISQNPLFFHYKMPFPIKGPWEDESDGALKIYKDTLETWFNLNEEELNSKAEVLVFTEKQSFYLSNETLISKSEVTPLFFNEKVDIYMLGKLLRQSKVLSVFYELSDKEFTYDFLNLLVKEIVKSSPKTILTVFNSPSESSAIQKLFNFNNIMSNKEALSPGLYLKLCEILSLKAKQSSQGRFSFKNEDKRAISFIKEDVTLVSINEHEIKFTSSLKIPEFTIVFIRLPVVCLLSIVEVKSIGETFVYTGVINAISSESRDKLRRIVNKFIFKKPEVIDEKCIEDLLKDSNEENLKKKKEREEKYIERQESIKNEVIDYKKITRNNKKKFSKI